MKGTEQYKIKYKEKSQYLIEKNQDIHCLKGFYNYIGNSKSDTTKYNYLLHIIDFCNSIEKDPKDYILDDYSEYLNRFSEKTSSYQITKYSAIKKFSEYLDANDINKRNPMKHIERPKSIESEETIVKRENSFLTKKEIEMLLTSVNDGIGSHKAIARQESWKSRDLAIIFILLSTGIRCAALYKLDISSIDYDKQVLLVTDKGNKFKEYPLSEELINVIDDWVYDRNSLLNGKEENALFISNELKRMDTSSIYRIVNKYSKVIEGKHITPHKLRATAGTQVYKATGDLYLTQEFMGHSNPKTTERYIRGCSDSSRKEGVNIMNKILF